MSIFDTILSSVRSLIGGGDRSDTADGSSGSDSARSEGTVSVEHEPDADRSDADASTESAVKGVGAETNASASTGTLVDEEAGHEPGEAVETAGEGEETVDTAPDSDEIETETEAAAAETNASASTGTLVDEETGKEPAEAVAEPESPETDEGDEPETDEGDEPETDEGDEPVETLTGIGPAYAERLDGVGIETVADLADADAEEIAANTDLSEKRVSPWIERAREQS